MKENFDICLTMLLKHEGGYVNHPKDPGGETNLGVTRAVYEQHLGRQVMEGEMKTLTVSDVAPIYKKMYWDKLKGDMLPSGLDWALFDWGVNSGTGRAAKVCSTTHTKEPRVSLSGNTGFSLFVLFVINQFS
jgi:lysozyme family protein